MKTDISQQKTKPGFRDLSVFTTEQQYMECLSHKEHSRKIAYLIGTSSLAAEPRFKYDYLKTMVGPKSGTDPNRHGP